MGIRYFKILKIIFLFILVSNSYLFCNDFFNESNKILFGFYHNYLSPLKSQVSECQFSPSCSEFAELSIQEYGFSIGILLTADRLIRCSGGHAIRGTYPFRNYKFTDHPKSNSLFGDEQMWMIGITSSGLKQNQSLEIDSAFKFPFFLYDKKDYQLSKLELNRIKFNSIDKKIIKKADLLISLNEFQSSKSVKSLENISETEKIEFLDLKHKYFLLNYFIADYLNLNTLNVNNCFKNSDSSNSEIIQKFLAYSYLKNNDIINSTKYLRLIKNSDLISDKDSIISYINSEFNYKPKSPLFAGILSTIIPGTGYMYAGRFNEGLSALIINGLLGYGIYTLFANDNVGSGILTSMVTLPFYLGNIIGSANAAENINAKYRQENILKIRYKLGISIYFTDDFLNTLWK
jgi:putative component of membrane protein insertase Oxa1/YidC/SpoIIIJ protein YidD